MNNNKVVYKDRKSIKTNHNNMIINPNVMWRCCTILFIIIIIMVDFTKADPFLINSAKRDYSVNDLIEQKVAKMYIDTTLKNFEKIFPFQSFDSTYVISNKTKLLRLNSDELTFTEVYVLPDNTKNICQNEMNCREVKRINLLNKIHIADHEFPILCYTYDFVYLNTRIRNSSPQNGCLVPKKNLKSQPYVVGFQLGLDSALDEELVYLSVKEGYLFVGGNNAGKATLRRNSSPLIDAKLPKNKIPSLKTKEDMFKNPTKFLTVFESNDAVYFVYLERDDPSTSCHFNNNNNQDNSNTGNNFSTDDSPPPRQTTITRIARVCKHDNGGLKDIQEDDIFGTFAKATLNCRLTTKYASTDSSSGSSSGSSSNSNSGSSSGSNNNNGGSSSSSSSSDYFDFHVGVDAMWNEPLKMLAVLYQSRWIGGQSSAVCLYNVADIEAVFRGNGLGPDAVNVNPNVCSDLRENANKNKDNENNNPAESLNLEKGKMFSRKHILRERSVPAWKHTPILIGEKTLWQKLIWKETPNLMKDKFYKAVVYLVTEDRNAIVSYTLLISSSSTTTTPISSSSSSSASATTNMMDTKNKIVEKDSIKTCTYDRHLMDSDSQEEIFDLTFSTEKMMGLQMIVSTNQRIVQWPLSHCSSATLRECTSDPYCRWNLDKNACMLLTTEAISSSSSNWLDYEPPSHCMDMSEGIFVLSSSSSSSAANHRDSSSSSSSTLKNVRQNDYWFSCTFGSGGDGKKSQKCWCQINNEELKTQNCAVDGDWSEWTDWSRCSQGCNKGLRRRSRFCVNPRPQNGGADCSNKGPNMEEELCSLTSELCQENIWSPWSPWTMCSSECGPGTQQRWRKCLSNHCDADSNNSEQRTCQGQACEVLHERSMWTPWLIEPAKNPYQQYPFVRTSRIRMQYWCRRKTVTPQEQAIETTVEHKICNSDGSSCSPAAYPILGTWSEWSNWTPCNQSCGRGSQSRERYCLLGNWCFGSAFVRSSCNHQPCEHDQDVSSNSGLWLAWSDWSPCSVSCGSYGLQTRLRQCAASGNRCSGENKETRNCHLGQCSASQSGGGSGSDWMAWSAWSNCDNSGFSTRQRICNLCGENSQEFKPCDSLSLPTTGGGNKNSGSGNFSITYLIIAVAVAFVLGILCPLAFYKIVRLLRAYHQRRKGLHHRHRHGGGGGGNLLHRRRSSRFETDPILPPFTPTSPTDSTMPFTTTNRWHESADTNKSPSSKQQQQDRNNLSAILSDGTSSRNPYESQAPMDTLPMNIQPHSRCRSSLPTTTTTATIGGSNATGSSIDHATNYGDFNDIRSGGGGGGEIPMSEWMSAFMQMTTGRRKARASTPPEQDRGGPSPPPLPPKTPLASEDGSVFDEMRSTYTTLQRSGRGGIYSLSLNSPTTSTTTTTTNFLPPTLPQISYGRLQNFNNENNL